MATATEAAHDTATVPDVKAQSERVWVDYS
jgi:hypothetical protein